jgi:hypothetical protein
MLRVRHHWRWNDVRRFIDPTGRRHPIAADESSCAGLRRSASAGTATGATSSPHLGFNQPSNDSDRGEPVAVRAARPVRREAWGNRLAVMPAPRPMPTQRPGHDVIGAGVSCSEALVRGEAPDFARQIGWWRRNDLAGWGLEDKVPASLSTTRCAGCRRAIRAWSHRGPAAAPIAGSSGSHRLRTAASSRWHPLRISSADSGRQLGQPIIADRGRLTARLTVNLRQPLDSSDPRATPRMRFRTRTCAGAQRPMSAVPRPTLCAW